MNDQGLKSPEGERPNRPHTPGPWTARASVSGCSMTNGMFTRFHVVGPDGEAVPLSDNDKGRCVPEAAGNVLLMAAAPTMLRALEAAEALAKGSKHWDVLKSMGWVPTKEFACDFVIRLCREAIDAARKPPRRGDEPDGRIHTYCQEDDGTIRKCLP